VANALYDKGRNHFLQGSINWVADEIHAQLITLINTPTGYTFNASLDEFFASVPTASRVGFSSPSLVAKTATSGIADANDTVFSGASGPTVGAIVLWKKGVAADHVAAPLIAYIDTATGLPVQPNGGDITAQWDSATNKIFKL
jgi:hypothetical protein